MEFSGSSIRVMRPLFQVEEGGSSPTLPLSVSDMWVEQIGFEHAHELNKLWHSKLPRMGTGFCTKMNSYYCFAATYKGIAYAVAIWSHPVAPNLPQHEWLELRRMAVSPERPVNTCSWMLSKMISILRAKCPQITTLVSYQIIGEHSGTIYKAANWKETAINKDGEWNRPGRSRPEAQAKGAKQRWERVIKTTGQAS